MRELPASEERDMISVLFSRLMAWIASTACFVPLCIFPAVR